jgi:hypothetical protein
MLHGTLHDFSEKDYELIVAAYKQAFSTAAGFGLNSFEIVADLDIPVGWMPDYWFYPDDSLLDTQLAALHESSEKTFCRKLQKSGEANFAHVHDCSFRYVYSSRVSEELAQQ